MTKTWAITAAAIDSNDGLHVSYQFNTGNSLKYAYKAASSTTWQDEVVDSTGGKYTSIAISPTTDEPWIAYRDGSGSGELVVATTGTSAWNFYTGLVPASDVDYTSIAVDSNNDFHVVAHDHNGDELYYYGLGVSGSHTLIANIGDTNDLAIDIAIDPTTNQPGISYVNANSNSLKYTYFDSGANSWSTPLLLPLVITVAGTLWLMIHKAMCTYLTREMVLMICITHLIKRGFG